MNMSYFVKSINKKGKIALLCVCALIIVFIINYFQKNVTSVIISISEASIKQMTTIAINEAIYYTLNDSVNYENLVNIIKDNDGNISAITANSGKINEIARDTSYVSQKNLKRLGENGIKIPLGALTGSKALAGFGPKITIKIIPVGNVRCEFVSKFDSVGINQTRHSIYLNVIADINLIMPTVSTTVASNADVLICESLIVGKIPNTYLNSDILNKLYNLVP